MSREHMDELLNIGLQTALGRLEQDGGFQPFGLRRDNGGEVDVTWTPEVDDETEASALVDVIVSQLKQAAADGECTAGAVVVSVGVQDSESGETFDAIMLDIEAQGEDAVRCFLPYSIEDDELKPRELSAEPLEPRIFAAAS